MAQIINTLGNDEAAMPRIEHQRAVNVLYAYLSIAFGYFVIFTIVYLLYLHQIELGIVHVVFTLIAASLILYLRITHRIELTTIGICVLAAAIVSILALVGSAANSGTYSVFGGSIFLFFMLRRRYYLALIALMGIIFFGAFILAIAGFITLPYGRGNYGLFLLSFVADNSLLILYGREKSKVDKKLNASLKEIRVLAQRLEEEKANVEEKVRLRTEEYRREHAKLESSINSLAQGFILIDANGKVELTNQSANKLFDIAEPRQNLSSSDLLQRHTWSKDLVKPLHTVLDVGQAKQLDAAGDNGTYYRVFITPVMAGRQVLGAAVIIEDISEAKILERAKDEFFSIASHELRTPLTAIRGNMNLANSLPEVKTSKKVESLIRDTYEASVRLIQLVNNFLDVSILEQGKMALQLQPIELAPLVNSVIKHLQPLLQAHGNHVVIEGFDSLPKVTADRERLEQVFTSVLNNASNNSHDSTITINAIHKNQSVYIRIIDTGKGISPEHQRLLFHKFQQAGDSLLARDVSKGSGLGLYISRLLLANMNGTIDLERSEVGKGSTFIITLSAAE